MGTARKGRKEVKQNIHKPNLEKGVICEWVQDFTHGTKALIIELCVSFGVFILKFEFQVLVNFSVHSMLKVYATLQV